MTIVQSVEVPLLQLSGDDNGGALDDEAVIYHKTVSNGPEFPHRRMCFTSSCRPTIQYDLFQFMQCFVPSGLFPQLIRTCWGKLHETDAYVQWKACCRTFKFGRKS